MVVSFQSALRFAVVSDAAKIGYAIDWPLLFQSALRFAVVSDLPEWVGYVGAGFNPL